MADMVRIRAAVATASGGRRGWIKHVTGVDTTKSNGYAFGGEFLQDRALVDLPVGAVLVVCDPTGSVKSNGKEGTVYRVLRGGDMREQDTCVESIYYTPTWFQDFLELRDEVQAALAAGVAPVPVDRTTLEAERAHLVSRIAEIDALLA